MQPERVDEMSEGEAFALEYILLAQTKPHMEVVYSTIVWTQESSLLTVDLAPSVPITNLPVIFRLSSNTQVVLFPSSANIMSFNRLFHRISKSLVNSARILDRRSLWKYEISGANITYLLSH